MLSFFTSKLIAWRKMFALAIIFVSSAVFAQNMPTKCISASVLTTPWASFPRLFEDRECLDGSLVSHVTRPALLPIKGSGLPEGITTIAIRTTRSSSLVSAISATQTGGRIWEFCAAESGICQGPRFGETSVNVRYGVVGKWKIKTVTTSTACSNGMFGDPAPGQPKYCERLGDTTPLMPSDIMPIASNFAGALLIGPGAHNPVLSMAPDDVGAFRFVCAPGQLIYADPILYPGHPSRSHLHQFYGNTLADANSTYASLRTTGESTCSNKLNRSAYWIPALFSSVNKVIVPDYLSIYYKRHANGDPACAKEAAKGCANLPAGLRVVSGYDTARMGQVQPENASYKFRCVSPGKPSIHHGLMSEAIADCGGSGQIMALINFGNCWTGQLDSFDHRSHLTFGKYIGHTYPECPASHPYLIPELTQQIAFTITASDGDVYFASDKMNDMDMPGGSTFHADYMEGWDPTTRLTWERNCIGKLLNCSDGELGDGRMLKRGALPLLASPRLIDAPAR